MTTVYLILSEATLPLLLWRALLRLPTCVVSVEPGFSVAGRFLQSLCESLRRRGWIETVDRDRRDLRPTHGFNATIDLRRMTAVYPLRERQMSACFRFDAADSAIGEYSIAYKHVCSNSMVQSYYFLYTLHNIFVRGDGVVIGLSPQMRKLYRSIFDSDPPGHQRPFLNAIFNVGTMFAAILLGTIFIVRALRISKPPSESFFLMSDYIMDHREGILWSETVDDPASLIVLLRDKAYAHNLAQQYPGTRACTLGDIVLAPGEAARSLSALWCDIWRLAMFCLNLDGATFLQVIRLPVVRIRIRALLARYRPRFFWSRDDYNSDHIIRSQELRRIGAVSMGIMHGVPTIYACVEQLRYIDYDIYYLFGLDQYDRWYKQHWPASMKVRSVGSFGLSRKALGRLVEPRPRNIACFPEPNFFNERVFHVLRELALAFSDRTVFVNVKGNRKTGEYGEMLRSLFRDGPPNLIEHTGLSYDLMFSCSYVIVDGSTLALEAIQFGLTAFHLDLDSRWKNLYFRDFPSLCVKSAEELVERIRRLDAGEAYPRRHLSHVIELSGNVVWDAIRQDMGLPPRTPAPLPHLAFAAAEDRPLRFHA